MKKHVWKIKYRQRFDGDKTWSDYEDTFLGPLSGEVALKEAVEKLWKQTLSDGGYKCTGVQVRSLEYVCALTI